MRDWLRRYGLLALRLSRRMTGSATGPVLVYHGPPGWRELVEREEPPPAGRLVEDAEALAEHVPFPPERARHLAADVRAMRAVARRLAGERAPLPEHARECLGITAHRVPEALFEQVHDRLDAALPGGPGSLAERLNAWRTAHLLPPDRVHRVPGLVLRAVSETRRRTGGIVPLPEDEQVRCRLVSGTHFRAAGEYEGGLRSTIHVNRDVPFNLADLLYVVAHEGHPGHIAEAVLKERLLGPEQRIRFLLTPGSVVGEGLGLHAQDLVFPGDEAQAWLARHVLPEFGIAPDGSDFAAIHRAQNALFGVWANAALLAGEGRPEAEVADYLSRWSLLTEAEAAAALTSLRAPGMSLYVLAYFHGWRLLDAWLDVPDRTARVRRLLTERVLPADVGAEG
ncbi:hypothetical protein ACWEFJ_22940 [Actinosynnema sp. NPDC004786]